MVAVVTMVTLMTLDAMVPAMNIVNTAASVYVVPSATVSRHLRRRIIIIGGWEIEIRPRAFVVIVVVGVERRLGVVGTTAVASDNHNVIVVAVV